MVAEFKDRADAGVRLAAKLVEVGLSNPVVFALPRGGVPVALPIAERLGAPMDLLMVRKIGAPGHEEFAIGAVVDGDSPDVVWNEDADVLTTLASSERESLVAAKLGEISDRRARYLGERLPVPVEGRDAILVDDGIATGATAKAALRALQRRSPKSVTLAVPVAPQDSLESIRPLVDRIVCLSAPFPFLAVGVHYVDFRQTTDEEVVQAMAAANRKQENRP